jgi:hypothetical protein
LVTLQSKEAIVDEWLWFEVLIDPVFLPYWFVSQMRKGKLPKMIILAVIIPTILGAVLGATFVVNSSEHAYQKAEFSTVAFIAILFGSLGALIAMYITYWYAIFTFKEG